MFSPNVCVCVLKVSDLIKVFVVTYVLYIVISTSACVSDYPLAALGCRHHERRMRGLVGMGRSEDSWHRENV